MRINETAQRTILYVVVGFIGIVFVFPFFWMVLSSFKLNRDILAVPLRFFPPEWTWTSYIRLFTA